MDVEFACYSLFREESDSRHHFKGIEEVFVNREKICRDGFLHLLREFEPSKFQATYREKLAVDVRRFMSAVRVENYRWLSAFFLDQLLRNIFQISDPELRRLTTDGEKLERLNRRMSQRPIQTGHSTRSNQHTHNHNHNHNHNHTYNYNSSSSSSSSPSSANPYYHQPHTPQQQQQQQNVAHLHLTQAVVNQFAGVEEFFYLFLEYADSYKLNRYLTEAIIAELSFLTTPDYVSRVRDVSSYLRKLRALGKFLGLLHFCPNYVTCAANRKDTIVFSKTIRQCISLANKNDTPLDVMTRLSQSEEEGTLFFSVIWMCSYLAMAKFDLILLSTQHVDNMLKPLRKLYFFSHIYSPVICLLIQFEIESLYNTLKRQIQRDADLVNISLQIGKTPANILSSTLESALTQLCLDQSSSIAAAAATVAARRQQPVLVQGASMPNSDQQRINPESQESAFGAPQLPSGATTVLAPTVLKPKKITPIRQSDGPTVNHQDEMVARLRRAFWDKHPRLYQTVQVVTQSTLQNAYEDCLLNQSSDVIGRALQRLLNGEPKSQLFKEDLSANVSAVQKFVEDETKQRIQSFVSCRVETAIKVLSPTHIHCAVLETATSIAVQNATTQITALTEKDEPLNVLLALLTEEIKRNSQISPTRRNADPLLPEPLHSPEANDFT